MSVKPQVNLRSRKFFSMVKKVSATSQSDGWSVGQIAERSGLSVATLHFYETKGLISSWRNAGNQRRYKASVLRRIAVIKTAQKLGISLEDIKHAMRHLPATESPSTKDWKQLSKQWRSELDKRIIAMTELRDQLDECIGCGCLSIKVCKLRNPDDKAAKDGPGPNFLTQLDE